MAKTYYYILVTKKGNPIVIDHKLPIYWNKEVAIRDRIQFCDESVRIKRIRITDLMDVINNPSKKGVILQPWM